MKRKPRARDRGEMRRGQDDSIPARQVLELATGFATTQALYVAVSLSIPDRLATRPKSADELAAEAHCDAQSLRRVLVFLASRSVFNEQADGAFGLTPLSEQLLEGAPGSMCSLVLFYANEYYVAWQELLNSVRDGSTAFNRSFGTDLFDYLESHRDRSALFSATMAAGSPFFEALAHAYNFSGAGRVVDVGGGSGALLASLLEAHEHLTGLLFEAAAPAADAEQLFTRRGLSDRCAVAVGDFFRQELPKDGDVYVLSRILHDWDDEGCSAILRNCRLAMRGDARLLVLERLLPPPNHRSLANEFDLHMMVLSSGRERKAIEYERLLDDARFRLAKIIPLELEVSCLVAVPS